MEFEPVRFSAALALFGTAIIALLTLTFTWSAVVVLAATGVWAGAMGLFNSLIIRGQVTPNKNVIQAVHDTIVELAPFTPVITDAVVPVASSPLLETSVVVNNHEGNPVDDRRN